MSIYPIIIRISHQWYEAWREMNNMSIDVYLSNKLLKYPINDMKHKEKWIIYV